MNSFNPLWRTYLFILCSSLVMAIAMVYFEWKDIKNATIKELQSANKIMASSAKSVLNKNEALLQVLGERLIELDALEHSSSMSLKLIDNLLKNNQEIAGFGLAEPSGQLVVTSSNMDRQKIPNLLESPTTAKTFKQALNSSSMVIGRTYYMEALKQWIIPLRYRITDENGDVVAVMATGLKVNSEQMLWSSLALPDYMQALIIRKDFYRQYIPMNDVDKKEGYTSVISKKEIDNFETLLLKHTGMDMSMLRDSGKTVSSMAVYGKKNIPVIISIFYDPTYENYTFIYIPMTYLYEKMIIPCSFIITLFFIFNATLYWVFRSSIRLEIELNNNLEFQANHDQLTELPNRRYLLNQFSRWQNIHNGHFSVLFIDLDNFKSINDIHGHSIGDKILCEVASRINDGFKHSLHVRQGGDEFIILTSEVNEEAILRNCHQYLHDLRLPMIINNTQSFSIGASIGIVFAPHHGDDVDTLLRKADMAMYEAKRRHSGVYLFSNKLEQRQQRRVAIEIELTHALARDEFSLVYQPQVNAHDHSIVGVEALILWNNPHLGKVSTDEFIPIAESTGIIIEIGLYVLKTALSELTGICHKVNPTEKIHLSINVSVLQLLNNNFLEQFTRIKNMSECNELKIIVEVTENLFIEDMDKAKRVLQKIQQAGMSVSLDDFGTGYSSLNVLSKLPINELKIDKSFVDDIMINEQGRHLILSIISIGKSLEIPVLAEGVELKEQVDFLTENGCNLFQGYYFSKPLNKEDLLKYILEKPLANL